MTYTLNPCSECGNKPEMRDYEVDYRRIFYVKCPNCGAYSYHYNFPGDAEEDWNKIGTDLERG